MKIALTQEEREAITQAADQVDFNVEDRKKEVNAKPTSELETEERKNNFAFNFHELQPGDLVLERILDEPDFIGMDFLDNAVLAARSVARLEVVHPSGRADGIATGFLISPNVLITNWHVIPDEFTAQTMQARFGYDGERSTLTGPEASFRLLPDTLFYSHKALDFAVVAVDKTSHQGTPLAAYGWIDFIGRVGDLPTKWYANIVQHPDGRPKEMVLRNNRHLKPVDNLVVYESDTEPGSSGSPVFNDFWQLVALHRTGIPARNESGQWIGLDGKAYDPQTIERDNIKWIANGGSKITQIEAQLQSALADHPLIAPILNLTLPDKPQESKTTSLTQPQAAATGNRCIIPVNLALDLSLLTDCQKQKPTPTEQLAEPEEKKKRKININKDYTDRQGYNPNFLDPAHPIALLGIAAVQDDLVPLKSDPDDHEIKYYNSTVVMSQSRRMAYFAAANANGGGENANRPNDGWILDNRIDRDFQFGDELYNKNELDKGHLNRSEDLGWGPTLLEAERSQDDTFHYPNCTPQHENFNRSNMAMGIWGALENWVLNKANQAGKPFIVFNGPVFSPGDPIHRGAPIPREYWKVIVVRLVDDADRPYSASAYLLSQAERLVDLPLELTLTDDEVVVLQRSLDDLKQLTKLDFDHLKPFESQNPFELEAVYRPIISPAQLMI